MSWYGRSPTNTNGGVPPLSITSRNIACGRSSIPLDLHVKHTSPIFNFILKRALPYLEPTRYDKMLQRFSNYGDLRAEA